MEALERLQGLLCERYRLTEPDDGAVFGAVAEVRESGVGALPVLEKELAARELYRWHEAIWALVEEIRTPASAPHAEAAEKADDKSEDTGATVEAAVKTHGGTGRRR